MRTAALLQILFFAAGCPAFSQAAVPVPPAAPPAAPAPVNPSTPDLSIPKDTSDTWQIGISVFSSSGLSPDNAYLAYSLPLLLKDEVSGLGMHTYQPEESDRARQAIISREILAAEKSVTAAWKERDALLFNEIPEGAPARSAAESRLRAARARLDFVRSLPSSRVDLAGQKKVTLKEGTGAGKLLETPAVPPGVYCAQQGIDLLVGGSIQEVQGYLILDIWAFDPLKGANVFTSRNAATREELHASLTGFGREIAGAILGRPWALVAFAPDPPDTALYVDGDLAASGASPALYLYPGPHALRLSAAGYNDVTQYVSLAPGESARIENSLRKIVEGQVSVSTDPPGADLYVDSRWKGRTPLMVDRPALRSRGVLSSTGFYDLSFPLGPASPMDLSFSLQKDVGKRDILQKKAREDFYVSLGFFAFSIPLPLISYGLSIDYAVRTLDYIGQGMPAAAAQSQTASTVLLGTYYAGIAVSVSLFVWMVTRIVRYVKVADETAG
jgi:hypothetical protein